MSNRLEYLDGLRGLAICGVVLIHVGQVVHGVSGPLSNFSAYGFRGVQLFFIVSALTLSSASFGKIIDLRSFFLRRFFRVAPMFYLAAIFYLVLGGLGPQRFAPDGIGVKEIILTLSFLHGFTPTSINSVVPGGWSIASEAIFYMLFPLLVVWMCTLRRAFFILVGGVVFSILSKFFVKYMLRDYENEELLDLFVHFWFPANLPAFLCGIFAFHLLRAPVMDRLGSKFFYIVLIISALILVCIGLSGVSALRSPLAASFLLTAMLVAVARTGCVLINNSPMRHIGLVSFSIYLTHFAIIHAAEPLIKSLSGIAPSLGLAVTFVGVLSASIFISTITYKYIEAPMIAFARRMTSTGKFMPPTEASGVQ